MCWCLAPDTTERSVVSLQDETRFLLIVRERLRPGSHEAYDANERQLAAIAAKWECPHPYLALAPESGLTEVWWLSTFASQKERDDLPKAYGRNQPLIEAMAPFGNRKQEFRETLASSTTEYRRDLSGTALRIAGTRYFTVNTSLQEDRSAAAVFESSSGEHFVFTASRDRTSAQETALRWGLPAMVFAVTPQWSFPAKAWVNADPEFWKVPDSASL